MNLERCNLGDSKKISTVWFVKVESKYLKRFKELRYLWIPADWTVIKVLIYSYCICKEKNAFSNIILCMQNEKHHPCASNYNTMWMKRDLRTNKHNNNAFNVHHNKSSGEWDVVPRTRPRRPGPATTTQIPYRFHITPMQIHACFLPFPAQCIRITLK